MHSSDGAQTKRSQEQGPADTPTDLGAAIDLCFELLDPPPVQATEPDLRSLLHTDDRLNAAYRQKDHAGLCSIISPHWTGFLPDGSMLGRKEFLQRALHRPAAFLVYERHTGQVVGCTGMVRGALYANGQHLQDFLRVYTYHAWPPDQHPPHWQCVCIQLLLP